MKLWRTQVMVRKAKIPIIRFIFSLSLSMVFSANFSSYTMAAEPDVNSNFRVQPFQGSIVAPDFTLSDLNGQKVKLSDFRGDIVVIGFFTTW